MDGYEMNIKRVAGYRGKAIPINSGVKDKKLLFLFKRLLILTGKTLLYSHGILFILVFIFSILYSFFNPPITSLMLYRKIFFHHDIKPIQYVPLKKIPRNVRRMFVKIEDYRFYTHYGIDLEAIKNAYIVNKRIGYNLHGGSTITQQLARTLFLIPVKSYLRKYIEILIAMEMDLIMKKERILELYLNYIEWGKGVFGIGSAASHYYKKRVGDLSIDEFVRLATILPNPLKYNVNNFHKNRGMVQRYRFLELRFL